MADNNQYSLEEILEEQRKRRDAEGSSEAPQAGADAGEYIPADNAGPVRRPSAGRSDAREDDSEDLNSYATGGVPQVQLAPEEEEDAGEKPKKKKKKKRGLFGRKNKEPEYDDSEDIYYGLQLKPIDEYRMGYDQATGEIKLEEDGYRDLFDDSKKSIADEVEQNFQRLQQERRRRVAEAVQNAGVDESEIADEFGVVAPMPVTAFAADPYAKQHGIEVEGVSDVPDIQKAMLETVNEKTMEIKLNVENDTIELQRVKDAPAVSEETINKILESAKSSEAEDVAPDEFEDISSSKPPEENGMPEASEPTIEAPKANAPEAAAAGAGPAGAETREAFPPSRPLGEIPQVASIYEYRSRGIPTHVINADVLQSALLSESEELKNEDVSGDRKLSRRRVKNKKLEDREDEEIEDIYSGAEESIDDYTGPEDTKSVSHELSSDMSELTMRMMITGVCTVLLAIVNIIFGGGRSEASSTMPLVYIILTAVFLLVAVGICYRTVINGIKALFSFAASSDSAVAVAAIAAIVQTVASLFFRSELASGSLHLYAAVVSALLFFNAAGKLTMIRRIHSNFRFVSSREQKYAVRTYDDYNTSLKMVKDKVVEKPLIAYQCKTGFLRRFLELSYNPDPAETASQTMAPIGLIATLVVCILSLLITRSVPTAISALAAASCACVAASNMLALNLPVSRLCKRARRAGAMICGYDAVEQLGSVNAVLVDAGEIFPRGTVVLNGIRTFGDKNAAEQAVMDASALMKKVGGPLSGVFDQVISENEDSLPEVEMSEYEDGNGIIGTVDGNKIYVGSRALLINHQIEVPALEVETQYTMGSKQVIYIAVNESVRAMLVLSYLADRRRRAELQRVEEAGVTVLIRTCDPCVTARLVAQLFGIDQQSIVILSGSLSQTAEKLVSGSVARADAIAATKGRMESMLSVISACAAQKRVASLLVAIQTAAVVLGFVLVSFLACFGAIKQLSCLLLFIFQAFWLLLVVLLPRFKK